MTREGATSRTGRGCSHDRNRPSRGRPATSYKAGPLSRESTLDVDARRVPPADGVAITTGEKLQYSVASGPPRSTKVRIKPQLHSVGKTDADRGAGEPGRARAAERARLPGLFPVPIGAGRETEVGEEPGASLRDLLLGRAMGRARPESPRPPRL